MDQVWNVLTTVGGWVAAIIVGLIAAFVPKKGSLENLRIDQYQEDRKALIDQFSQERAAWAEQSQKDREGLAAQIAQQNVRLDAQSERTDRLEKLLLWYQRRDVAWERREAQIIIGVERGDMPPWPAREGILLEPHP